MASKTRTSRTRSRKPKQQDAEAQAAADAAADIAETAETQAVPEGETPQPEAADAKPAEPTPEEVAAAEAKAEEERFAADVATAEKDIQAAMKGLMPLHQKAVESKAAVDNALKTWRDKNASSIKTLEGCKVRLSAARTALRNEWAELINADEQTTTVENEGETPDTVYFNALHFEFDEGVAEGESGPREGILARRPIL